MGRRCRSASTRWRSSASPARRTSSPPIARRTRCASSRKSAAERGIRVIIAGAGGSAALPGAIKAYTSLPVIGVPLASSDLKGVDALMAIAQMPPGVPVATVAVGKWGARNAALLAAEILALSDEAVRKAYEGYRQGLASG